MIVKWKVRKNMRNVVCTHLESKFPFATLMKFAKNHTNLDVFVDEIRNDLIQYTDGKEKYS